jgi:murein DD-endopeptidase MepM/ murein hydrolase activator NlpD
MQRHAHGWASGSPRRLPLRFLAFLLVVPLAAGLIAGPAPGVSADELDDALQGKKELQQNIEAQKAEIEKLHAAQASLKAEISQTAAALKQVNADLDAIATRIKGLEVQIAEVQRVYDGLVFQLRVLATQLVRLKAEAQALAEALALKKEELAERIRIAYSTNRTSILETFLSGESFTDVIAEVDWHLDVGEQDRALALAIERDQATLDALKGQVLVTTRQTIELRDETAAQKAELDARVADLREAKRQLEVLKKETARALSAQRSAYAKLDSNKAAADKALKASEAAQRRLQAQIEELIRQRKQYGNIPSEYNGTFIWPMAGRITQEFGCTGFSWEPPLGSCAHFHKGIDIAAPMYAPVKAAGDGVVVFAGANPYDPAPKAWIVIIAHSETLISWYAHLDNATKPLTVRAGESVKQGEVIGYNGMTGRTTGPHLHWMIERNGSWVNPRLFV